MLLDTYMTNRFSNTRFNYWKNILCQAYWEVNISHRSFEDLCDLRTIASGLGLVATAIARSDPGSFATGHREFIQTMRIL